ncbi:MAG: hypothetical protein R3358_06660 [Woeseiaceae bacterium]|nr:hypothetical protein [Woeseiaceae bacterium]
MRFTVAGNKVICSRTDNTVEGENKYRQVVEFDAHLDEVPPHVAARLTQGEIEELQEFLEDRKRIQAKPAEVNMLEVLPELIEEATQILHAVNRLNETMYRRLRKSIAEMVDALDNVKPQRNGKASRGHTMRDSEARKERLENIKKNL